MMSSLYDMMSFLYVMEYTNAIVPYNLTFTANKGYVAKGNDIC